jgi:HD superfamily phosphohydrolase YqeK
MHEHELSEMQVWFNTFCASHRLENPKEQANLDLKQNHTFRVCENSLAIASSLNLSRTDRMIAEAIALFHDVGRFIQYVMYKTFRDDQSENHALLSEKILQDNHILDTLPPDEQQIILTAVRFHNVFTLPDLPDKRQLFFLKMIRDADKIDILRVFIDADENGERASAIDLGLAQNSSYSPEALQCIAHHNVIALQKLCSIHDLRLLHLSWIFDLNFTESIRILRDREYPQRIAAHLPQTDDIRQAVNTVVQYMEERCIHD